MGGKHQADSLSAMSMAARSSERGRKPPRFSLRRIFYRARQSATPKPMRVMRSQSEVETRSNSSVQSSHATERDTPLHSMQAASEVVAIPPSAKGVKNNKESAECPVCLTWQSRENFPPVMTCHHRSCRDCLKKYMRIEITESRINITCPECNERFHPNDIQAILEDPDLMGKYEEFMMRRILVSDPDTRWCPAPDCGYAVIAAGCASCPKLHCERPGCDTFFCYHCKQYWHPNQTCDAARAERSSNLRSSSISFSHESGSQKDDIKPCPRCGAFINKMDDGSCNHMTCAVCGAEFCWLCMKEISDLHYLSPSGCTFWGKKPWSRKKKILWQLGTLVGAPVGIALIAGIAVPAIIIGVPVWVGRRLHTRYSHMNKHKRNLVVAGGVMASILVSPILAGLAVGIGVPILLAYVYGVVPISLCRSGGCGVTTTDSGGVRFEFDDDNNEGNTTANAGTDTHSVDATVHNVANPSIGPSIGEMSVAMTGSLSASGSHMDRVGALRDDCDRDSASQRALAGASLTGSLCDSGMPTTSSYHNRLEVQADVSNGAGLKRNSLSSESANFSLDAKSATVSFGDDVSTKALAGSICNRDKDGVSAILPPLEVQVDVLHSAAYYQNGATSHDSHPPHRGQGSPTSNRSVNFAGDEILGQPGPSRRKYKTPNLSVGNSIHEYSESDLEEGSTSNLGAMDNGNMTAADKHSLLTVDGYAGGVADNVSLVLDGDHVVCASCSQSGISPRSPRDCTLTPSEIVTRCHSSVSISSSPSPRSSVSGDCMGQSGGLTEVESDRPYMSTLSAHSARSRSLSACSSQSTAGSTGTDALTVIDHPTLEGTTNCAFHCESPEEEMGGHTKDSKGCVSVSVTLPMPCDSDQLRRVSNISQDISVSISVPALSSSSSSSRSSRSSSSSTHSQQALLDADLTPFSRCTSLHTCESGESLEGAVGFTRSSPSVSSGSGSICETSVLIAGSRLSSSSSTCS